MSLEKRICAVEKTAPVRKTLGSIWIMREGNQLIGGLVREQVASWEYFFASPGHGSRSRKNVAGEFGFNGFVKFTLPPAPNWLVETIVQLVIASARLVVVSTR